MITATQGLVLHTTKYSETSIIAKIFTRQLGVGSYIVKGVRSAKSRTKQNLLQPLSHLDMAVYDSTKKEINYIKEMQPCRHYPNLLSDPVKVTLLFFMSEVLYLCVREHDASPEVFDYVVEQLEGLDEDRIAVGTQPLLFLLQMASFLGIEPQNNYSPREPLFCLNEGRFVGAASADASFSLLSDRESLAMHYLMAAYHGAPMPQVNHREMLGILVDYFKVHLVGFRNFKSHEILHSILV